MAAIRRSGPEPEVANSFDHLVGDGEYARRNGDAVRLCCLEVDNQLELGWLYNRQIRGLGATENPPGVEAKLTIGIHAVVPVADQPARESKIAPIINRGQP